MKPEDLEALERFCPETRVIRKYYEHPDNRKRAAITVNEQEWDAIAACIVRLGRKRDDALAQIEKERESHHCESEDCKFCFAMTRITGRLAYKLSEHPDYDKLCENYKTLNRKERGE